MLRADRRFGAQKRRMLDASAPSFVRSKESLLRDLAADLAAGIGLGVDVDVVLAGREIGGLGVGQRGAALGRAGAGVRDRDRDTGILAGFGGTMEMRRRRGTGQA